MSRIRSIKPEFFRSLDIADLSIEARLHFIGLWTHVDDEGRELDNPRLIRAAVWPLDDMADEHIETLQAELAKRGRIVRYEVAGRRYFQVLGWHHQRIDKRRASTLPPPPTGEVHESSTTPPADPTGGAQEDSCPDLDLGILGSGSRDPDQERSVLPPEDSTTTPVGPATAVEPHGPTGDPATTVFDAWTTSTGRTGSRLDPKRRKVITAALRSYPLDDVLDAVRGWQHSPHHRGENDRRTVYNDLELLLRDASQIEKFRDLQRRAPSVIAAPPPDPIANVISALSGKRTNGHKAPIETTGRTA